MSGFGYIAAGLLSGAGKGMVANSAIKSDERKEANKVAALKEIAEAKEAHDLALEKIRNTNNMAGRQFTVDEGAKAQKVQNEYTSDLLTAEQTRQDNKDEKKIVTKDVYDGVQEKHIALTIVEIQNLES